MDKYLIQYVVLRRQFYKSWDYKPWDEQEFDVLWISKEIEEENRTEWLDPSREGEYVYVKRDSVFTDEYNIQWSFSYEDRFWSILPL